MPEEVKHTPAELATILDASRFQTDALLWAKTQYLYHLRALGGGGAVNDPDTGEPLSSGAGFVQVGPDARHARLKSVQFAGATATVHLPSDSRGFRIFSDGGESRFQVGVVPVAQATAPDGDIAASEFVSGNVAAAGEWTDWRILEPNVGADGVPDSTTVYVIGAATNLVFEVF